MKMRKKKSCETKSYINRIVTGRKDFRYILNWWELKSGDFYRSKT